MSSLFLSLSLQAPAIIISTASSAHSNKHCACERKLSLVGGGIPEPLPKPAPHLAVSGYIGQAIDPVRVFAVDMRGGCDLHNRYCKGREGLLVAIDFDTGAETKRRTHALNQWQALNTSSQWRTAGSRWAIRPRGWGQGSVLSEFKVLDTHTLEPGGVCSPLERRRHCLDLTPPPKATDQQHNNADGVRTMSQPKRDTASSRSIYAQVALRYSNNISFWPTTKKKKCLPSLASLTHGEIVQRCERLPYRGMFVSGVFARR